jgi:predicted RNA-binding Zn-ribbon protein involved in translation (DUF1610 family)
LMLDETATGFSGPRRVLAEHLTCGSCGGHHAMALTPVRSASRTYQCRECGFQWEKTAVS